MFHLLCTRSERYWEIEENEQASVAGKIQKFAKFWESELDAPPFILDIVKTGYSLPFITTPPPAYSRNNKSSKREHIFTEKSIKELLKNNSIHEDDYIPHCVNPLSVAERNNKLRLVLDLRNVNKYIQVNKFKYENLKTASDLIESDDFMITFDLKSGYHHVPINANFYTYLGFSWEFDGVTKYFVFVVLPFGLCSACWVFTKLMRQLVKKWRGQGIKSIMYLDDGIAAGYPKSLMIVQRNSMVSDLMSSGLTINIKKSSLEPEIEKEWLGFTINTNDMRMYIPNKKLKAVLSFLDTILRFDYVTTRSIAKFAGRIIAMSIAIGPLTRLFTRQMYKFIDDKNSLGCTWDSYRPLTTEVKSELTFWKSNLSAVNGLEFKTSPEITKICYSDASQYAYGGFIVEKLNNVIAQGNFSNFEANTSSTYRELSAVKNVLSSLAHKLKNNAVQWNSDNENVTRIINAGSTKEYLQKLAIDIYNINVRNNIRLYPQWIPREKNQIADSISKSFDTDNWSIDNETFNYIQNTYGVFTIDRFADNKNTKTERFNSKNFCPNTEEVNSFVSHWGNELNWLCPPTYLIGKAIKHLKLCRAKGVLFVPVWKSSYFWPLLTRDGINFESFIKHFLVLDPFYFNYSRTKSVFEGFAKFYALALLIDFSE